MKFVFLILSIFVATSVYRLNSEDYFDAINASKNYLLLDVRMYEKYQVERIPGAKYAGERSVLDSLINNIDTETVIFIYCSYGDRSIEVIEILKNKGFSTIYDLREGFDQWYMDKMPVDTFQLPDRKKR